MAEGPEKQSPSGGTTVEDGFSYGIMTPNSGSKEDVVEPIAVVGYSLKFPQDATSSEGFWQMLVNGRSAMSDVPKDRFNLDAFYHPDMNVKGGHFLVEHLAVFDAPFFSLTPAEAASMDPQQRWLLETSYRALENAGIPIENAAGSNTSVYVGSFMREYEAMLLRDPELQKMYLATGTQTALVGGCNLFFSPDSMVMLSDLNFLSPDSKCYSFDHRANGYARGEGFGVVVLKPLFDALRDGNTIRAVIRATGSNQDARTPGITQPSSRAQEALIRDTYQAAGLDLATTRFFEAHGTGTPVGDPIEVSAIEAAFRDQTPKDEPLFIGAVKSNIGHLEGASGIAGLIKSILVLEKGVIPPNIWYERPNPKILLDEWNIKFPLETTPWPTNGLRRASVNSFGFGGSNAHVVIDDAYNYLQSRDLHGRHNTAKLPPASETLTSVSSGTQAIDNGPWAVLTNRHTGRLDHTFKNTAQLLVWSAADEGGIDRLTKAYLDHSCSLSIHDDGRYLRDLAYTLSTKRSSLPWKSFVVASSIESLQLSLKSGLSKPIRSSHKPKLGFVFTGQGAQWFAMGRELLKHPGFHRSLVDAESYFQTLGCEWLLTHELQKDKKDSNVNDPILSQPLCTAIQIALVDLIATWGIHPSVVVGHSSGEIAAAYCADGISRESAWKIAYFRGLLAARLSNSNQIPGSMISVGLSEAKVIPYLLRVGGYEDGDIAIGCINSPQNVTITGEEARIDDLCKILDDEDIFNRKLKVNVAYHSRFMKSIAPEYQMLIDSIKGGTPLPGSPAMFSSVTGERIFSPELGQSEYWVRNMIFPVRFSDAISHVLSVLSKRKIKKLGDHKKTADGVSIDHVLEIGPHAALRGPLRDILNASEKGKHIGYSSLLSRGLSAVTTTLEAVGRLYCLGYPVNLEVVNHGCQPVEKPRMLIDLPEYPFNHTQKHWLESRISKTYRFRKYPRHELLGTSVADWNPLQARWRNVLKVSEFSWIKDHKVNGSILYPAAGMLVMAIEAARQLADASRQITGYRIKGASFHKAIFVPSDMDGIETQICLQPARDIKSRLSLWSEFRIYVHENGDWSECCKGAVAVDYKEDESELDYGSETQYELDQHKGVYEDAAQTCQASLGSMQFYDDLESVGLCYGPTFQALKNIYHNDQGEAVGLIDLREWQTKVPKPENHIQPHVIHPTALDGVLQLLFPALTNGMKLVMSTMVPTWVDTLWISESVCNTTNGNAIKVYTKAVSHGISNASSTLIGLHETYQKPCIVIQGCETTAVASRNNSSSSNPKVRQLCWNLDWKPDVELLDERMTAYCATDPSLSRDKSILEKELVCYISITKALESPISDRVLESKPYLQRHVLWMRRQCNKYNSGTLNFSQPQWMDFIDNKDSQEELFHRIASSGPEGELIVKVGQNLSDVFNGQVEPLDLLFKGNLMGEYYAATGRKTFGKLARYVNALAFKNPTLKILEIGSGTGATTKAIFHALVQNGTGGSGTSCFSEYAFTDISPSFFEKAREIFSGYTDRVTFTTLDIEQDPLKQGYEAGYYDVVVAANVLHATTNLDNTFHNVRKLLKPGGKLLLCELCNPEPMRMGFIFGLLPGWWLGVEDSRKWGPQISVQDWHDVLLRNRFSGIDVAMHDCEDEVDRLTSAFISSASDTTSRPLIASKIAIIIAKSSSLQATLAQHLKDALEVNGSSQCSVLSLGDFDLLSLQQTTYISLLEVENSFLDSISKDSFSSLQKITSFTQLLIWVTSGGAHSTTDPKAGMVTGLSRSLRSENSKLHFVTLGLQDTRDIPNAVDKISGILRSTLCTTLGEIETEYVEQDGMLCIPRVIEASDINHHVFSKTVLQESELRMFGQVPTRPLSLSIRSPGSLDSLEFVDDTDYLQPLASDEIEIKVRASGLNFKDVLVALGQVGDDHIGQECAGIVSRIGNDVSFKVGDRVVSWEGGSMKTYCRSKAINALIVPDDMSLLTAASHPAIFSTAYYSLICAARAKSGESVLIHSGAGGLGQALIQVAKYLGLEIFVTVGSEAKKKLLMDEYNVQGDHVFSSRTLSFSQGIKRMTRGRGVDVVVNTLSGEGLRTSWECIAPSGNTPCFHKAGSTTSNFELLGRFIEAGLKDILSHGSLPMFQFAKNAMFASVDFTYMKNDRSQELHEIMHEVMSLMKDKKLSELRPVHVYNVSQLVEAYRYLQSGKSTGKTIIEFRPNDEVPTVPSAMPTYYFDPNASYLIAGGLGGLGRSIARWMVARKAKYLILLSRKSVHSKVVMDFLKELQSKGVVVATPRCDVTDDAVLAETITECSKIMPSIKGCVQASLVLKDGLFEGMSLEDFQTATIAKVEGSWNLHAQLNKGLDFFVLLSSTVGIVGGPGQSNYATGNTYQDALAHYRVANGEKAVAIDLGMVLGAGYVAEHDNVREYLKSQGYAGIREAEFLALMDYYCNPALPVLSPLECQVVTGLQTPAALRSKHMRELDWMQRRLFSHLHQMDSTSALLASNSTATVKLEALLASAESLGGAGEIICNALATRLSTALAIPRNDVDTRKAVHSFGVDSLMAVELRNWFAREVKANVAIFEVLSNGSMAALALLAAGKSLYVPAALKGGK
ncbi:hypothetical protein MMC18_002121 [Xylographa bjoerkii]|nr:hypothetical protein [Xylographa bjoerkii]